jgi:hypothetical protein
MYERATGWPVVFSAAIALGCGARGSAAQSGGGSLDASVPLALATQSQADDDRAADKMRVIAASREAMARDASTLTEHQGAWIATHFGQGYETRVDATGATMQSAQGQAWKLALHVTSVGRAGAMHPMPSRAPGVQAHAGRVELARGDGVREWYFHDARGLEQGVDLAKKPAGDGPLVVEVAIDGLSPAMASDGRSVELRDARGARVLTYGQLAVKGGDGRSVASTMAVEHGAIAIRVQDAQAAYPLAVDPLVWALGQAKLTAADGADKDSFGLSVALSGNTALVGAPGSGGNRGAVYVFARSGTTWTEQLKLTASDGAPNDFFGTAVALSGGIALVGASGKLATRGGAYVFAQSGTSWAEQAKLTAADGVAGDMFGAEVALSGTTALIGASGKASARGAAYVFVQSGTNWPQQAKLTATGGTANDQFGCAVALEGNTALVGASNTNSSRGAAYVFVQSGTTWPQQATLTASDAANGDEFGFSVALSGSTALIGARGKNAYHGAAYPFAQSGTTWTELPQLTASDGAAGDQFGYSVALSGTSAVVGAEASGSFRGAGYAFVQSGTRWMEQAKLTASDGATGDGLGASVAVSGSSAVVGAFGASGRGAAYVFVQGLAIGDPCTSASSCVSGFCVDGVCCDGACGGTCQACTAAKKGSGADGACGFVAKGTDPDRACPTNCTGSTLSTSNGCAGTSAACAPPTVTSCAPSACDPSGVACASSSAPPKISGAAAASCKVDGDCASGHCADGVCCDKACTGTCESCALPTSPGVCALVPIGLDPKHQCSAKPCDRTCDGAGGCITAFAGAQCSPSTCTGATTAVGPTICSAVDATCGVAVPFDCSPYACAPQYGACYSECKTTADCAPGTTCDTATKSCVAVTSPGGGGCGVAPSGRGSAPFAFAWFALVVAARRHRRTGASLAGRSLSSKRA